MESSNSNNLDNLKEILKNLKNINVRVINDHLYFIGNDKESDLAFSIINHGDEIIGTDLFCNFLKDDPQLPKSFYLIIGNIKAYNEGKRFIQRDLNRLWGKKILDKKIYEESIIDQVSPYLQKINFLIDFHQSRYFSNGPFFVPALNLRNYHLGRTLDENIPICFFPDGEDHGTGMPLCSYITSLGGTAVTIELGSIMDDNVKKRMNRELGINFIKKMLTLNNVIEGREKNEDLNLYFFEKSFSKEKGSLDPKIVNLFQYHEGEMIGPNLKIEGYGEGVIIFPQHDKTVKEDKALCYLMKLSKKFK